MKSCISPFYNRLYRLINFLADLPYSTDKCNVKMWTFVWETFYAGFEANGKRRFREYYEEVRCLVPRERLLEISVTEGWGPLCRFLGREVPTTKMRIGGEEKE